MKGIYFMGRIRHLKSGTWDKGIEIKEAEADTQKDADEKAKNMAYQSYHAYLGLHAYGNKEDVDYVGVSISNRAGLQLTAETWDKIEDEEPVEEELEA